jgi:hypothetical protein
MIPLWTRARPRGYISDIGLGPGQDQLTVMRDNMGGVQTCRRECAETSCPFAFTEISETIQNYGCLPEPQDIVRMRVVHGKTWACHSNPELPCIGAIQHLRDNGLPYNVIDPVLLTEKSDWYLYT